MPPLRKPKIGAWTCSLTRRLLFPHRRHLCIACLLRSNVPSSAVFALLRRPATRLGSRRGDFRCESCIEDMS